MPAMCGGVRQTSDIFEYSRKKVKCRISFPQRVKDSIYHLHVKKWHQVYRKGEVDIRVSQKKTKVKILVRN